MRPEELHYPEFLDPHEAVNQLEHILAEEIHSLKELQKLHFTGRLSFGKRVSKEQLGDLVLEVKKEVDIITGNDEISMPHYRFRELRDIFRTTDLWCMANYYPHYEPTGLLVLERRKMAILIPQTAHEYTHHAQRESIHDLDECLEEGHSLGIEKNVAKRYAEKEDNPAFLYGTLDRNVYYLKFFYKWLCDSIGVAPNKRLLRCFSMEDLRDNLKSVSPFRKEPTEYHIGVAVFCIREMNEGVGIYKLQKKEAP